MVFLMHVCLDFDGVLHDGAHRAPGRRMGPPMPGALDAIRTLVRDGHTLVIHSARVQGERNREHIYDWLDYFGFPPGIPVAIYKPLADLYIDDKGYHFLGWDHSLSDVLALLGR